MSAKSYNRTIQAHKLTLEALWLIVWAKFLGWAKDRGFDDADLQRLSKQLAQSLDDNGEDETPSEVMQQAEDALQAAHLLQLREQYDKTLPPTTIYWRHYMNMVIILLMFTCTERSGDWQMHKSAFLSTLPMFVHYDHTNYMRLDLTRFNKSCHPSQRPRWQVDKEAIGLSRVQQCSSTYNPPSWDMCLPCF